jgi:hypothetical protein
MPSLFNVFPESSATGDGLGSSIVQQTITQAYANCCAQVIGTTDDSNDHLAFVQLDQMTYTIPIDGLYFVIFGGGFECTDPGATTAGGHVRLLQGVSVLGAVTVNMYPAAAFSAGTASIQGGVCLIALCNLIAGEIISVDFKAAALGDTISCNVATFPDRYYRRLILIRLGGS